MSNSFSSNIKRAIKKKNNVTFKFVNKINSNDFNLFLKTIFYRQKDLKHFFILGPFFLIYLMNVKIIFIY